MPRRFLVALACGTALLAGACANPNRMDPTPMGNPTATDPATALGFLTQAQIAGALEVNASRLAATRASSASVQSFAKHMVENHVAANQEVLRLASARGVPVPPMPTADQKVVIDKLASLSGPEFDREYATTVGVIAHERTVRLFRDASRGQRDSELRAFAQKMLPALEQHLEAARQLERTVAASR